MAALLAPGNHPDPRRTTADTAGRGLVSARVVRCTATELVAVAEALLATAGGDVVGVHASVCQPPALVLGSGQRFTTVDEAACAAAGIDVVRRGSGGGAVLCDAGLLQVDVALPMTHRLVVSDVSESYRWLGRLWCELLAAHGVRCRLVAVAEARMAARADAVAAQAACFAGRSPFEVVTADGRKLVGLAQRRRRGAVLFQSAAVCRGDPARVLSYLRLPVAVTAQARTGLEAAELAVEGSALGSPDEVWRALAPALATVVASEPG